MNDKYQIIIQPEAQKAIEDAYFWFSNISHQKARTWLEGLYKSILSLEIMPSRCSLALPPKLQNFHTPTNTRWFFYLFLHRV